MHLFYIYIDIFRFIVTFVKSKLFSSNVNCDHGGDDDWRPFFVWFRWMVKYGQEQNTWQPMNSRLWTITTRHDQNDKLFGLR